MPYGNSRLTAHYQAGDPFLGGLIKGAGKFLGGAAKGLLTGGPLGAIAGGIGAFATPQPSAPAPAYRRVTAPPVNVMPGGGQAIGGMMGGGVARTTKTGVVTTRKRPRMNPMNPKAARRAARRLDSYTREYKKIEKTLRKLAPPRRSSRRDLGRGHTHVR